MNLKFPVVDKYDEDVLMLVGPNTTYDKRLPIQVESFIIGKVIKMIDSQELEKLSQTWNQAHAITILLKSLQFDKEKNMIFNLNKEENNIITARRVVVPLLEIVEVKDMTNAQ